MKNWKFAILVTGFMGLLAFQTKDPAPKRYKVEAPIEFWVVATNGLDYVKQQLKQSDIPSKTVTFINDSLLTTLQAEISKQVNQQLTEEKKKDSVKPKK